MKRYMILFFLLLTACYEFEDFRTQDITSLNDEWTAYSSVRDNTSWVELKYEEVTPIDEQTIELYRQGKNCGGKLAINLNFNSARYFPYKCFPTERTDILTLRFSWPFICYSEARRDTFWDTSKIWLTVNGKRHNLQLLNEWDYTKVVSHRIVDMKKEGIWYRFKLPDKCLNLENAVIEISGIKGKGQDYPPVKARLNYVERINRYANIYVPDSGKTETEK